MFLAAGKVTGLMDATRGGPRYLPLMPHPVELLRDYLASCPARRRPEAPLLCSVALTPIHFNRLAAECSTPKPEPATTPTQPPTVTGHTNTTATEPIP